MPAFYTTTLQEIETVNLLALSTVAMVSNISTTTTTTTTTTTNNNNNNNNNNQNVNIFTHTIILLSVKEGNLKLLNDTLLSYKRKCRLPVLYV
jgi:hypothetical protein